MKELPRNSLNQLILGDGEVTGHAHSIATPGVQLFELTPDLLQLKIPPGVTAVLQHTRGLEMAEHRDMPLTGSPCVTYKRQYGGGGNDGSGGGGWSRVQD